MEHAGRRLLFSGDTGYGPHIAEIGRKFYGFHLVALDMGQYDERWPYLHMTPEEAAQAAEELQAKALLPAHVGRFSIARHPWDEPFQRIAAASEAKPYRLPFPPFDLKEGDLLDERGSTPSCNVVFGDSPRNATFRT